MRRERELMERRKREPQLEQAQDHLVRKIFSRFRRERSVAAAPGPAPARAPPAAGPAAASDAERADPPAPAGRGKWGRLLATGSLDASAGEPARSAFTRSLSARDRSLVSGASSDATAASAPAPVPSAAALMLKVTIVLESSIQMRVRTHTVTHFLSQASFAKARSASALSVSGTSTRQDTIEEELEERRPSPSTAPPPAPAPHAAPAPAPPATQAPPPSPHDAALAELRRDVRTEVQRLQQKVRPSLSLLNYPKELLRLKFLRYKKVRPEIGVNPLLRRVTSCPYRALHRRIGPICTITPSALPNVKMFLNGT